jgi:helix-turn-helix protein
MVDTEEVEAMGKAMAVMQLRKEYLKVIQTLAQYKSMPFLELVSVCGICDTRLDEIVQFLEDKGLVRVTNRNNVLEKIVTLKERGFELVKESASSVAC